MHVRRCSTVQRACPSCNRYSTFQVEHSTAVSGSRTVLAVSLSLRRARCAPVRRETRPLVGLWLYTGQYTIKYDGTVYFNPFPLTCDTRPWDKIWEFQSFCRPDPIRRPTPTLPTSDVRPRCPRYALPTDHHMDGGLGKLRRRLIRPLTICRWYASVSVLCGSRER
jgi:hypothetical protein